MGNKVSRSRGARTNRAPVQATSAAAVPGDRAAGGLRATLVNAIGGLLAAPVIGLFAGFLLLFGGIFLAVAWTVGPQPAIDALRYAAFSGHASGRILESWAALEFDPADLPKDKLRWQPYAKISSCLVVEYAGDWGAPLRRGFCGNRFTFRDDFRLDDWNTMAPGVPFAFARDASGFAVAEVRVSRAAFDWLSAHAPHDTFMLGKPPPATALAALKHQFDAPLEVAVASWTTPFPAFPLAYDPQRPEAAMPARLVEDRRNGFWWGSLVFTVILCVPGLYVWRTGMNWLTGQGGPLLWALTLAPLLALPWWGDVLPRLVRHANSDWATIASDMLDDIARVTRFSAAAPADVLLAGGERIAWHIEQGIYADTFGRIAFAPPQPPPRTRDDALAALRAQASTGVRVLDASAQKTLFERLRDLYEAGQRDVQALFYTAAEDVLRDRGSDPAARLAARRFLIFGSGGTYYEDQLDRLEGR